MFHSLLCPPRQLQRHFAHPWCAFNGLCLPLNCSLLIAKTVLYSVIYFWNTAESSIGPGMYRCPANIYQVPLLRIELSSWMYAFPWCEQISEWYLWSPVLRHMWGLQSHPAAHLQIYHSLQWFSSSWCPSNTLPTNGSSSSLFTMMHITQNHGSHPCLSQV